MPDPYPFRGIFRWVLLPTLLVAAGVVDGLLGWWVEGAGAASGLGLGAWLIPQFSKAAVVGASLALGRHPAVALVAALVLGGLSLWMKNSLYGFFYGWHQPPDVQLGTLATFSLEAALMVGAHHAYLRLRRYGRKAAVAAGLLFPVAAFGGNLLLLNLWYPAWKDAPYLRWAVEEGAVNWIVVAVALRIAEGAKGSGKKEEA